MTGYTNGSGKHPERDDNKIASLDDARRRAKERAKASAKLDRRPAVWRDYLVGGVIVLMAVAMLFSWLLPLLRGAGLTK